MALDVVIKDRESVQEITTAILKKGDGDLMCGVLKDLSLDGRPISTTYDLICQSVDLFPERIALEYIRLKKLRKIFCVIISLQKYLKMS